MISATSKPRISGIRIAARRRGRLMSHSQNGGNGSAGVAVGVGKAVAAPVMKGLFVAVGSGPSGGAGVLLAVAVWLAVEVAVAVALGVEVLVAVAVGRLVAVALAAGAEVAVRVLVGVSPGMLVGVTV